MTKAEAIIRLIEENGGTLTLSILYEKIGLYYPEAYTSDHWQEGLRGVLYRDLLYPGKIKKIGLGIFALRNYQPDSDAKLRDDPVNLHTYLEGICVEIGNYEDYLTFTADGGRPFKGGVYLRDLATLAELPKFSYPEIVEVSSRIDVIWFNKSGYRFPVRAFEIVISKDTLDDALLRAFQLRAFDVQLHIIGKSDFKEKFKKSIKREPFVSVANRFIFRDYKEWVIYYDKRVEIENMKILG